MLTSIRVRVPTYSTIQYCIVHTYISTYPRYVASLPPSLYYVLRTMYCACLGSSTLSLSTKALLCKVIRDLTAFDPRPRVSVCTVRRSTHGAGQAAWAPSCRTTLRRKKRRRWKKKGEEKKGKGRRKSERTEEGEKPAREHAVRLATVPTNALHFTTYYQVDLLVCTVYCVLCTVQYKRPRTEEPRTCTLYRTFAAKAERWKSQPAAFIGCHPCFSISEAAILNAGFSGLVVANKSIRALFFRGSSARLWLLLLLS